MARPRFKNPFRPGAGHMPPYLAGRGQQIREFRRLLAQDIILENLVLTGLRGTGKTVLLETFRPLAIEGGWNWVGTDLSESVSISEERLALRLITDLAVVTSATLLCEHDAYGIGFQPRPQKVQRFLDFNTLVEIYETTPGLVLDKLKAVLQVVWGSFKESKPSGIVFAYDEAQNLADHGHDREYPLSLLLDLFQSIQRKGIPFMLVLVGLPTLFPKLVDARTFAERMFHVVFLNRLNEEECNQAISRPLKKTACPPLNTKSQALVVKESGGYPYFLQFICREVYDVFLQQIIAGKKPLNAPVEQITHKLDTDFFSGRWARATDRQRELLIVVSHLDTSDGEFSIQQVFEKSRTLAENDTITKPFSPAHVNQMFNKLADAGLIFKNRHGKYSFAVPLFGRFILRQL